jgi:similar to stage IV sporulation protein
MLNIINFFRGNVRVELTSDFPERFINVCAQNNIPLWDIQRTGPHTLVVSMLHEGYKKSLSFIARGVGQIKLINHIGLPPFLWRFRRRFALIISLLIMSIGLFALSLFVWEIDVNGNESIPKEVILQELRELGIGIGTYRRNIDSKEIQNLMILKIPEIEWLAVNVRGSRADVGMRERDPIPVIIPKDTPCNIVSKKDGLIISMYTFEGSPAAAIGDAVEAGQLLVSGLIDSNIIGMRQVHARADITARTWYEYTSVIPSTAIGKRYTGRETTRRAVILGGHRINLFWGGSSKIPVLGNEKTVERKTLRLGDSFALPFVWVTERYTEYEPTEFKISRKSADAFMRYALDLRLNSESDGGEVRYVNYNTTEQNGVYQCEMAAECLESIAVTVVMP